MNAISTFAPSAKALAMVATARQDAGATNPVSEGAVLLAEYLAERETHPLVDFLGGWGGVHRLMADGYMPGNDIGEEIGHLTNGVLTPQMWRREWGGDLDVVEPSALQQFGARVGAQLEQLRERFGSLAASVPSLGALGTTPRGPLFRFQPVEDEPSLRQIAGLGIAFQLSDAGLCALRDAANAAIADLRGGAEA
jgi:hypothetical protein